MIWKNILLNDIAVAYIFHNQTLIFIHRIVLFEVLTGDNSGQVK